MDYQMAPLALQELPLALAVGLGVAVEQVPQPLLPPESVPSTLPQPEPHLVSPAVGPVAAAGAAEPAVGLWLDFLTVLGLELEPEPEPGELGRLELELGLELELELEPDEPGPGLEPVAPASAVAAAEVASVGHTAVAAAAGQSGSLLQNFLHSSSALQTAAGLPSDPGFGVRE